MPPGGVPQGVSPCSTPEECARMFQNQPFPGVPAGGAEGGFPRTFDEKQAEQFKVMPEDFKNIPQNLRDGQFIKPGEFPNQEQQRLQEFHPNDFDASKSFQQQPGFIQPTTGTFQPQQPMDFQQQFTQPQSFTQPSPSGFTPPPGGEPVPTLTPVPEPKPVAPAPSGNLGPQALFAEFQTVFQGFLNR